MRKIINWAIGFVFIVPGFFMLLQRLHIFNIRDYINVADIMRNYWPSIFIIIPGLFLQLLFFAGDRNSSALIFTGGALSFMGIITQISVTFSLWGKLWPGFILAPAIGLFEYFIIVKRERGILIEVIIISGISSVFFSKTMTNNFYGDYILACMLISLGLIFMFYKNPEPEIENKIKIETSKHEPLGTSVNHIGKRNIAG